MLANKHPFTCCPATKHQNAANLALQTCEKAQQIFLQHRAGSDFSFRSNFTNIGSFAKVSVAVGFIIPQRNVVNTLYVLYLSHSYHYYTIFQHSVCCLCFLELSCGIRWSPLKKKKMIQTGLEIEEGIYQRKKEARRKFYIHYPR